MSPDPVSIPNTVEVSEIDGKKVRLKSGVLVRLIVENTPKGPVVGAIEVEDNVSGDRIDGASHPGKHWGYFEESDLFYVYRSQLMI